MGTPEVRMNVSVEGPKKQFMGNTPLGERNPALKGMGVEFGKGAIKLTAPGEAGDQATYDALRKAMSESGKFAQDGEDEFLLVDEEARKNPVAAIEALAASPEMQEFIEARRPAMEQKQAERDAERERKNEAAAAEAQKRRDDVAAVRARIDGM